MRNPQPFLDPRETFEHYENRSRPTSSQSFEPSGSHGRPACDYRAQPPQSGSNGVLACEYRANPQGNDGVLACEYRREPPDARYRIDDNPATTQRVPKITTYIPESTKKKVPLGVIIAVAIIVPVVLVVCLFGAVWLQELGLL